MGMPYKDKNCLPAIESRKRANKNHYDRLKSDPIFKKYNSKRFLDFYYRHRNIINLKRKVDRDIIREEIIKMLGGKCVICNYDGIAIQIDHVKGNGCKHKRLTRSAYYKLILEEIKNGSKDYQLLCATHNIEKKFNNHEGVKIWE